MSEDWREFLEKVKGLERSVAEKRGDFALFGLFAREDLPDRWDLIVAAPWATDPRELAEYLVTEFKSQLGKEDLINLSRIVPLQPDHPAVQAVTRAISSRHGDVEVRDSSFFGLPIKHAYIITSQQPNAPAAR